jgi:hypothetical protein
MWAGVREGKVFPTTSGVYDLLGRPPRSFGDWAKANATAFS